MLIPFYILAAMLIWFSYKSFRGGFDYLNYFRTELSKPESGYTPFATVIVPCRGIDEGMDENLARVVGQDYPEYEVVFVVDEEADLATGVIRDVSRKAAEDAKKIKLIVAPKSDGSSQKVENLREAVQHATPESEVFVFADSDARPSVDWLRNLVAPLQDSQVGAATGYRWFISKKPTFGSEMRSVWNASIASALGPKRGSNFCWGGSMAIRRETFEKIDMRERWHGTLSDDFAITRAVKDAGLDIHFVPRALAASVEDCTFRETLEFTTRQMKITRVYAPHLWAKVYFGSGLFTLVMISAFAIAIFSRTNSFQVIAAIVTIALVSFFSVGKSWLRLSAVKLVLKEYDEKLQVQNLTQNTLWLLTPPLFLYNAIAATISRRMTWRGIKYELKSPSETVIIAD